MHNLDRTTSEFEFEDSQEFEYDNEYEYDDEDGYEFEDEYGGDEFEYDGEDSYESGDVQQDNESPFSEEEEMELATELLSVSNEEELDQFLGGLLAPILASAAPHIIKGVAGALSSEVDEFGRKRIRGIRRGGMSRSKSFGRFGPLFRGLKRIVRVMVPVPMNIQDSTDMPVPPETDMEPAQDPSAMTANSLDADQAAELFGLEMEGMSYEDREFEIAKRFVNLAGEAFKQAGRLQGRMSDDLAAHKALELAANRYAPGLNRPASYYNTRHQRHGQPYYNTRHQRHGQPYYNTRHQRHGQWQRQGNNFTLYGFRGTSSSTGYTGGSGRWRRDGNRIILYA